MYQLKGFINLSVIYFCETAHNLKKVEPDWALSASSMQFHLSAQALPCSHTVKYNT